MSKISRFCFIVLVNLVASSAFCDLNVQSLRPTNNFGYMLLEDSPSGQVLDGVQVKEQRWFYGVQVNSVSSPLVMYDANGKNGREIVSNVTTLDMNTQYAFSDTWSISAFVPLHSVTTPTKKEFALGDVGVGTKHELVSRFSHSWGVGLSGELYIPTGAPDKFVSNESTGGIVRAIVERDFGFLSWVTNTGYANFEKAKYRNIDYSSQFLFGTGVNVPLGKKFALNVEGMVSRLNGNVSGPGDSLVGLQYAISENAKLNLAYSAASVEGGSSDSFRVIAGFKILPGYESPKPAVIHEIVHEVKVVKKVVKTIEKCGPVKLQKTFGARRLSGKEKRMLKYLPYKSTVSYPIQTKDLGEFTNSIDDVQYVKHAQVVFAFDLQDLPVERSLVKVDSAVLKMSVKKLLKEKNADHEILCLLNERVCSGELAGEVSRLSYANPRFFKGKETPNDYFSRQTAKNLVRTTMDGQFIYGMDLSLDLHKIIENSLSHDVRSLLYAKSADEEGVAAHTLYFAVGENTYVASHASLNVSLTADTCQMGVADDESEKEN